MEKAVESNTRGTNEEALQVLKESGRNLPFIIVSGTIEEKLAAKLIETGAEDYIGKHNLTQLPPAVERVLAHVYWCILNTEKP